MNRFLVAMVLSTVRSMVVRKMSAPSLPRRFIHLTPSPRPKYRGGVEVWVEASVEALSRDFALVVASQEPFLRASGEADSGFHGRPSTNRPGIRARRGPGRPNHPPPTFTWSPAEASAAEGLRSTSRPFSARRCSRLCLQIECCTEVARG
jgi:hypothetical protein